jgi:hypothetical protein
VAVLDLTEVAFHCFQSSFAELPGEKRPPEDQVFSLAHTLAQAMVKGIVNRAGSASFVRAFGPQLTDLVEISQEEISEIVTAALSGTFGFIDRVCTSCVHACLKRPRKGMAEAFFAPCHPSSIL